VVGLVGDLLGGVAESFTDELYCCGAESPVFSGNSFKVLFLLLHFSSLTLLPPAQNAEKSQFITAEASVAEGLAQFDKQRNLLICKGLREMTGPGRLKKQV
jgi:hypothetical protein